MFEDFVSETEMLAHADVIIGQFYSSLVNYALFRSRAREYISIDRALPCVRGGCPSALSNPQFNCPQANNWYPGVCPRACRSVDCVPIILWDYLEAFQRQQFSCQTRVEEPVCIGNKTSMCFFYSFPGADGLFIAHHHLVVRKILLLVELP